MKRILFLIVAALLFTSSALAEVFVINYTGDGEAQGYALLLTDSGEALTEPGVYANLYALTPEGTPEAERLYQAEALTLLKAPILTENEVYGYAPLALMGPDGRLLTGFDYYDLRVMDDGTVAFTLADEQGHRAGVMDRDGKVLIPAEYDDVQALGDGRWLALSPDRCEENLYDILLLDAQGRAAATGLHTYSRYMPGSAGGLCCVSRVAEYDDRYVYIDRDGAAAFDRGFDSARPFDGNLAVVQEGELYGLIDRDGQFVLPTVYDYIYSEHIEGTTIFVAENGAELTLVDGETGTILMRKDFAPANYISASMVAPDLVWIYADGDGYLCRTDGTRLGTFTNTDTRCYQWVHCTADAPRALESWGSWPRDVNQLIDLEGNPVGGEYMGLNEAYWRGGAVRYVASTCRVIEDADGDASTDWRSWRYGVADENGEIVLPIEYLDYIDVLSPDRYWVSTAEKTGMVDGDGKWYYAIEKYGELMD